MLPAQLASMYCTKCGRKLAPDANACPACGSHIQRAPKTRSRAPARRLLIWSAIGLLSIVAIFLVADRAGLWHGAHLSPIPNANLAESASFTQPHMWNAASTTNPSVSDMLLLPQADTGFVGSWGGFVYAQTTPQQTVQPAMTKVPMSYYFGQSNGEVFLKTQVYGDPKWPVVKDWVKVLNSKSIEFGLDSMCSSCTPPVRQQEVTRLTLDNGQLDAQSNTYAYASGDGHVEFDYKGTLHPLTPDELAALDHEVEREGTFLKSINSKVPAH